MKKYVRGGILCFLIAMVVFVLSFCNATTTPAVTVSDTEIAIMSTEPVPQIDAQDYVSEEFLYYVEYNTPEECLVAMHRCEDYIVYLNSVLPQNDETLRQEVEWVSKQITLHHSRYIRLLEEEAKWDARMEQYPTATTVWLYLSEELGFNDYVCAGIIGNMMSECGGRTLKLKWWEYDPPRKYYGLCQWSKKYYSEIMDGSLEEQLDYLGKTIKKEMNTYGYKYKKGFNYEAFTQLTDARQAALAFAKCYERCASGGYVRRQNNADTAYNYFTD